MKIDKVYSLCMHGDFMDIAPTIDALTWFLTTFSGYGFIPSVVPFMFNGSNNMAPAMLSRINLVDTKGIENITIEPLRIAYSYNCTADEMMSDKVIESINKKIASIFSGILTQYKKTIKQVSIYAQTFVLSVEDCSVRDFLSRFKNPVSYFENYELPDFGMHLGTTKVVKVHDKEIPVRIISDINRFEAVKDGEDSAHVSKADSLSVDVHVMDYPSTHVNESKYDAPRIYESFKQFSQIKKEIIDSI